MDEEARMLELKSIVTKAEEGIKTAEKDIAKFDGQLSDGQRVNDEQIVILMSKNPGWNVKEAMDSIYKTTPHKLTHLEESRTKAIAARNFFRKQLRQASDELQSILPTGYDEDGGICAYSDPIQATVMLTDDGQLNLERVTFKAWQAIKLPRAWDDPEKSDPYPDDVLTDFAIRIAKAINILENNLARLVEGKA